MPGEWHDTAAVLPPLTRDPIDDTLIAYAVTGQAGYQVSGDKEWWLVMHS